MEQDDDDNEEKMKTEKEKENSKIHIERKSTRRDNEELKARKDITLWADMTMTNGRIGG